MKGLWSRWLLPWACLLAWMGMVISTGRSPAGDGPHLLGTAMRLSQMLRDLDLPTFAWCLQSLIGPHPPLSTAPALAAYTLVGTSWSHGHLLAGALVLWLLWDALRRMGAGLVGALMLGATSPVWLQAEQYGVDLLAAAAVVQSVSHLVASQRLGQRSSALWWAAWMGVGFMTKYTAPLFLAGPCLLAGWWTLRHGRWSLLARAVGTFVLVAGLWYGTHLREVAGYLGASRDAGNDLLTNRALVTGQWTDWPNLSWYPAAGLDAVGWGGALAMAVGALGWWRRRGLGIGAWVAPMLALGTGWLALAMQIQRQDRYLVPALVLLAGLVGSSRLRWLLAPLAAVGLYGNAYIYATFQDVPSTRDYRHQWEGAGRSWPWPQAAYLPTSLDVEDMRISHGLQRLREVHGSDEGTVALMLDEERGGPNFGVMLSETTRAGFRWHLATVLVMPGRRGAATFVGPFTTDSWPSREYSALLAIISPNNKVHTGWLEQGSGMTLVESWKLPRGLEGRIYRR